MPKPNLREQLLSAGLDTLHQRGFNGTSVQDITRAAGAPKGSFYNHFESKEALGVEVVGRYVEEIAEVSSILLDTRLDPLSRLRAHFEAFCQRTVRDEFSRGCLLGNFALELSSQSPLIREHVSQALRAWTDQVAAVIREGQDAGSISKDSPPEVLAEFLVHAYEGALLRAKVDKDRAPLDAFLTIVFTRILS